MRIHIALPAALVAQLDRRVGARKRSKFIAALIEAKLDEERRWNDIESALGGLQNEGHDWDEDPAEWVRRQRRGDTHRSG